MTLVLTYRERTAEYRTHLFQRQMSKHEEIAAAAGFLYDLALDVTFQEDATKRAALLEPLAEQCNSFYQTMLERWLLIEPEVTNAYGEFVKAAMAVASKAAQEPEQPPANDDLASAFLRAINASRAALGTGPLTRETMRTIGGMASVKSEVQRRQGSRGSRRG